MKCPRCGTEVPQTKFCTECGAKLPESTPVPIPAPTPASAPSSPPVPPPPYSSIAFQPAPPPPPKRNIPLLVGLIAGAVVLVVLAVAIVSFAGGEKAESAPAPTPESTLSALPSSQQPSSSSDSTPTPNPRSIGNPITDHLWSATLSHTKDWTLEGRSETGNHYRLHYKNFYHDGCTMSFGQSYCNYSLEKESQRQALYDIFLKKQYTIVSEEWKELGGVKQLFCEYTYPGPEGELYALNVLSVQDQILTILSVFGPQDSVDKLRPEFDAMVSDLDWQSVQIEFPGNARFVRPQDWQITEWKGPDFNPTSITYSTGETGVDRIRFDRTALTEAIAPEEMSDYCRKSMMLDSDTDSIFSAKDIKDGPTIYRYTCGRMEGGKRRSFDIRMIVGVQETYTFTMVTDPEKTVSETIHQLDTAAGSLVQEPDNPIVFDRYTLTVPSHFRTRREAAPDEFLYYADYEATPDGIVTLHTMPPPEDFSGSLEELGRRYHTEDKVNYRYELTDLNGVPAVSMSYNWTDEDGKTYYEKGNLVILDNGNIARFYFSVPVEMDYRRIEDDFVRMMRSLTYN